MSSQDTKALLREAALTGATLAFCAAMPFVGLHAAAAIVTAPPAASNAVAARGPAVVVDKLAVPVRLEGADRPVRGPCRRIAGLPRWTRHGCTVVCNKSAGSGGEMEAYFCGVEGRAGHVQTKEKPGVCCSRHRGRVLNGRSKSCT